MRTWHLVAYDIRDEVRLRRVARIIEGYGERVQYSVFRCRLSARSRAELLWRLSLVMAAEDSLLIIPLCAQCRAAIISRGTAPVWPERPPSHIIV